MFSDVTTRFLLQMYLLFSSARGQPEKGASATFDSQVNRSEPESFRERSDMKHQELKYEIPDL